ncbi:hypothetical protein [Cylindrospermopsis raciborskii]|nr:hypothetical protein [Cylindrospermopsis raciborskii]MCZ2207787.1 hypothetical protein [Cylindrospermopsis raciborskii PAMP2011]
MLRKRFPLVILKGKIEGGYKGDRTGYSLTSPFSREIYERG